MADEAPCIRLRAVRGLSDGDLAAGMSYLMEQVEENLGMSMIFTLVGAAKEWLRSKSDIRSHSMATLLIILYKLNPVAKAGSQSKEDPAAERKKKEAEEDSRRAAARAHGTPVTPAAFAAWKAKVREYCCYIKVSS